MIKARFDEQGNPIPIIIIGDNGKGILKKEEFFDLVVNNEQNNVNCEHFCELFDILDEISKL